MTLIIVIIAIVRKVLHNLDKKKLKTNKSQPKKEKKQHICIKALVLVFYYI